LIAEGLNSEARDLTNDEYHQFVRLSPNGEYVATVRQKPDFGDRLYITDLLGNPTCLSDRASRHPSWSGAKKVSYLETDQSGQQTHVIQVNIENLDKPVAQPVTTFAGKADWLDINPADATKLVVVVTVAGKQQIVLRDLERKKPDVVIAEGLEYANLRWSSDGSTLAWSGPEEAGRESTGIWVMILGVDTKPRRIVTNGYGPVWRADSSVIYFGRVGAQSGLFEFDMKTNKEKPIRDWEETDSFDVKGQRLVYSELGSSGKIRVYSLTVE
jgi:Tol biopolymer transport system component